MANSSVARDASAFDSMRASRACNVRARALSLPLSFHLNRLIQ